MTNMQFRGKLTAADLNDVGKMTRSQIYWLRLLFANWYRTGLMLVMVYATISGLLGPATPSWRAVGLIWAVVAAIVFRVGPPDQASTGEGTNTPECNARRSSTPHQ